MRGDEERFVVLRPLRVVGGRLHPDRWGGVHRATQEGLRRPGCCDVLLPR